jgi:hypothetical protein
MKSPVLFRAADIDPSVPRLRLRHLLKMAGVDLSQYNGDGWLKAFVGPGPALLIWTAAVLAKRAPLTAEQQDALLDYYSVQLTEFGSYFANSIEKEVAIVEVCQLTIADGTFAGLSGSLAEFFDLRTGGTVTELPAAPIEVIGYNLAALFAFHVRRLESQRKQSEARGKAT